MEYIMKVYDVIGNLLESLGIKYFEITSSEDGFVIALKTKNLYKPKNEKVDPPAKNSGVVREWKFKDGEIYEES